MDDVTPQPTRSVPGWAWGFVAVCGAIPLVSLGGIIPGILGAVGATTCYGIARDGKGAAGQRMIQCALVTLLAWGAFGGMAWVVISNATPRTAAAHPAPSSLSVAVPERGLAALTTQDRQDIYADIAGRWTKILDAERELEQRVTEGRSTTVFEKRVALFEKTYDQHLEFVMKHKRLTSEELDAIIAEGEAAGWPSD